MEQMVIALLLLVNNQITEARLQPDLSSCLKGKRQASRNTSSSIEYRCIKTKAELEKGLESITTINYNSTNNNFDAMVQEIDQIALKLIAANSQNKVREKLKLADSGPLKRCLKFLEENVECLE